MIEINREEAMKLREAFPSLRITTTNRKKARAKTYYLPEEKHFIQKLMEIRNSRV